MDEQHENFEIFFWFLFSCNLMTFLVNKNGGFLVLDLSLFDLLVEMSPLFFFWFSSDYY